MSDIIVCRRCGQAKDASHFFVVNGRNKPRVYKVCRPCETRRVTISRKATRYARNVLLARYKAEYDQLRAEAIAKMELS